MSASTANSILGYPEDARLLIINADDLGMCHANNAATLESLLEGVVSSTSLMIPCPWAPHAISLLREHQEIDFGVHLTIVSEHDAMRWGPHASRNDVSTLLDVEGYFFRNSQSATLLSKARIDQVEIEFRAQIDAALAAGLSPTHLDWHCLHDGGRDDIFDLTVALANEYGLALRVQNTGKASTLIRQGLPVNDRGVLDSYTLSIEGKLETYLRLLRQLPAGLSEWAVHPSLGDSEAQAMEDGDWWQVRTTDFEFVMSRAAREVIHQEGIVLIRYEDLQKLWNQQGD